jgi:hypothetical protein
MLLFCNELGHQKAVLIKECSQLKPSDLALVLQRGIGASEFLAKILGDTPLFPFNTQFCFPLPSLLLLKSCERKYSLTPITNVTVI